MTLACRAGDAVVPERLRGVLPAWDGEPADLELDREPPPGFAVAA